MPLTTPHESSAEIRAAIRVGIIANPAQAAALRSVRAQNWSDPVDVQQDLADAVAYLRTTPVAQLTLPRVREAVEVVAPHVDRMADAAVTLLRDRLRSLLANQSAPPWLRLIAERLKRAWRVDVVSPTVRRPDRQASDPCVVAAEAALIVLQSATSTEQQIQDAGRDIERWRELTPHVPNPTSTLSP